MQDILPEQFVFTYIDTRGNINKPLHADYLNNKMKNGSIIFVVGNPPIDIMEPILL